MDHSCLSTPQVPYGNGKPIPASYSEQLPYMHIVCDIASIPACPARLQTSGLLRPEGTVVTCLLPFCIRLTDHSLHSVILQLEPAFLEWLTAFDFAYFCFLYFGSCYDLEQFGRGRWGLGWL